jgi:2'-5' RNA ligase
VSEPAGTRTKGQPRIRLFLAFDLPRSVRDAVDGAVDPWRQTIEGARWAPAENWHVTLKFLGQADPVMLAWIEDRVREAASSRPAFMTRVDGLGCFPGADRARVVWAGLRGGVEAASAIAAGLDRTLAARFEPATRPFTPHLTLARLDPPSRLPDAFLGARVSSEPFEVKRIVAYRSHPGGPAPRYEALWSCPLAGALT